MPVSAFSDSSSGANWAMSTRWSNLHIPVKLKLGMFPINDAGDFVWKAHADTFVQPRAILVYSDRNSLRYGDCRDNPPLSRVQRGQCSDSRTSPGACATGSGKNWPPRPPF